MVPLLLDENFNSEAWASLRSDPGVDVVRVQDLGLRTASDETIVEWASQNGRVLVTHDARTIPKLIKQRIFDGVSSRGVFLFSPFCAIGVMVNELKLMSACSDIDDWDDQVQFLPF